MSSEQVKVKHLVVDSGAFLKNSPLHEIATNVYTTEEVIGEIKSRSAREQLQVLPYDVEKRQPEEEDRLFVTSFAKKTGDYFNLSSTDIEVIALAVNLERRQHGGSIAHLNEQPKQATIISNVPSKENKRDKFGFNFNRQNKVHSKTKEAKEEPDAEVDEEWQSIKPKSLKINLNEPKQANVRISHSEEEDDDEDGNEQEFGHEKCGDEKEEEEKQDSNQDDETEENTKQSDGDDDGDEEGDWISPSNIDFVKKQFESLKIKEKEMSEQVEVACITGDFSMQNVLMQMGIKVISIHKGLLITHTRQFVLRCIACFKITNNMSKMFCPQCGNLKTLKKVSVSVDENGQKRIHLNPKRPVTTKDVKLCIPRPRRGKHALNPILVPDQHVPKLKPSKFAVQEKKTVAQSIISDVGYLIRDNPFSVNDVYSKASNYRTGSRAATINKAVFNEGRKHANKCKDKRRN